MDAHQSQFRRVQATVEQVLPVTGIAYVTNASQRSWAITRGMRGTGLDKLQNGQQVELLLVRHDDFDFVSEYAQLD